MKGSLVLAAVLPLILTLGGCESMTRTESGALTGGLIGATAGGIIGHQFGSGVGGALIGGALGAVGGGLIGNQLDEMDRRQLVENPSYLPITNIVDMASKGVPDDVIIGEIQRTHSSYHLTSEVITYLKQNRVSDRVINYMLATG